MLDVLHCCCISTFLLIYTDVVVAIIRKGHLCRPYDKNADYYYPARRQYVIGCLASLLLLPVLIHYESYDAWLFARVFLTLYMPMFAIQLVRRYFFFPDKKGLCTFSYWYIPPTLLLLVLLIFAFLGGDVLRPYSSLILGLTVISALFLVVICSLCFHRLRLLLRKAQADYYSNEEDFPVRFSKIALTLVLIVFAPMWAVLFVESMWIIFAYELLLCVLAIFILLVSLHPHKTLRFTIEEKSPEEQACENEHECCDANEDCLMKRIDEVVKGERLYLQSNLTLDEVAKSVGSNRTYTSAAINSHYSSFLQYINCLRIEHMKQLQKGNPSMTQTDLMLSSGFNSRNTFVRWLKWYEENNKTND